MLENNKCILVYGLTNIDLELHKKLNYKIIEITPEMCEMTLGDILLGLKLNIYNNNPFKGKVILYNNLTQNRSEKCNKMILKEVLKMQYWK